MTDQQHGDDVQRIQIENLPPSVSEASVLALFEPYGEVVEYEQPEDDQTEVPGAYVLLRMTVPDAETAIAALDGQKLDGQSISVRRA